MIELISLVAGGLGRLVQHWLDLRDKDAERKHELEMFDKQAALADRRFEQDRDLRQMDADSAQAQRDMDALIEGMKDQAAEVAAAGGWVAKLSASVRPVLTYWHCLILYGLVKGAMLWIAYHSGTDAFHALLQVYGAEDRAIMCSIISYWFVDRSLRKRYSQ
jgi:hypothetical protein